MLLILAPLALHTFRSAVSATVAGPLHRQGTALPFSGSGPHLPPSSGRAWLGLGPLAAIWCAGLGARFRPDTQGALAMRSMAATSRLESSLRVTTHWLEINAEQDGVQLLVDEDPGGFDDLPISYFSGFPFQQQLRRRYERYQEILAASSARPRWLVLFDQGRILREGEVNWVGAEQIQFRGEPYLLRHRARVSVFEKVASTRF